MKKCIICNKKLTAKTQFIHDQRNYINKCKVCIRKEKRIFSLKINSKIKINRSKKHILKLRENNPIKAKVRLMYSSAQKRAKKMKMEFNLTTSFIFSICPFLCPIMKEPLLYKIYSRNKYTPSIDRINSSLGYTKDNVQVISYIANLMKNNATKKELHLFSEYYSKVR